MSSKQDNGNTGLDIVKWLAAVVIIAAGLFVNYQFTNIALPIRIIGWIFIAAIALFISAQTAKGKLAVRFIADSRIEMRKVVWPNRQETVQSTIVVLVIVVICGVFLWVVDTGLISLIGWLTGQRG